VKLVSSRTFILILLLLSLVSVIPLGFPVVHAAVDYEMFGAFNEQGYRDGAINATLFRKDDSPLTVEVDGWNNITETQSQIAWKFDLGYNVSRTFYSYQENETETIYIFKPDAPYYTYYFTVYDYLGVEDAYLETLLNINGSDLIVERWSLEVLNALPFTCSWGTAYKLRLVCDLGSYYYDPFVASGDANVILGITDDMFPVTPTDISQLVVSAERQNVTWIQSVYSDAESATDWIWMGVYEYGNETYLSSTNVSASTLTWNWYGADIETHYYVNVTVSHERRGLLTWVVLCPVPSDFDENPWAGLPDIVGSGFPISASQFIGIGIVLLVFISFSSHNSGVGIIIGTIVAAVLVYINWLDISVTWIVTTLAIAFIVAFSIYKDRERTV